MKVAVSRGARHYQRSFPADLAPDDRAVSDEEIGVALCLEEHSYDLDMIRAAAQLLSSPRIDVDRLRRLAVQERCEPVLLHIANVAEKYAPEQQRWKALRATLPSPVPNTSCLPHWTRLVSHTGVAKTGLPQTNWLRHHE
jgi:hypothetical protein